MDRRAFGQPVDEGDQQIKSTMASDLRQDGTFQNTGAGEPGTAGPPLRGRWRIVTRAAVTALILYWGRAEPTYHRLDRRGEAIFVDDVPTSVIRPE